MSKKCDETKQNKSKCTCNDNIIPHTCPLNERNFDDGDDFIDNYDVLCKCCDYCTETCIFDD